MSTLSGPILSVTKFGIILPATDAALSMGSRKNPRLTSVMPELIASGPI
jgi:hypothetical protein